LRSWFSFGSAEAPDQHFRLSAPDGSLWHVLSFGGQISESAARAAVHDAVDGLTAKVNFRG